MVALGAEESDRYGEVGVLYDNFLWSTTCFFVCLLCPMIMVIQSHIIYTRNVRKRARFATLALSV